jgi:methionyl aminopeptidase
MIELKSKEDIEELKVGGKILAKILDQLSAMVQPEVATSELDLLARKLIKEAECEPAFLNYSPGGSRPYPAALCVSVNDAVVHGLPGKKKLKEGDLVGLDLGLIYRGKYYLDSARSVAVGVGSAYVKQLIAVTYESLSRGIEAAQPGGHVGDIGEAVQRYVEGQGFEVVRQLVGHGVGFAVHEEPQVPNFGKRGQGIKMEPGLVIAIEPMVTKGDPMVGTASDGWSVIIETGEWAAHAEHTIAITENGPVILTLSEDV